MTKPIDPFSKIRIPRVDYHCSSCGKKLIPQRSDRRYDQKTGEAKCDFRWKCPDLRWYNRWLGKHTIVITDELGNEMWQGLY